ncbi:MAG TPA: hypothetical protein VMW53_07415 [archaeon]|nr:hypothetical protein [archaeon]
MAPRKMYESRLSVMFTQKQLKFIQLRARLHDVNKADIIRDALDLYMLTAPKQTNGFLKKLIKGVLQEER